MAKSELSPLRDLLQEDSENRNLRRIEKLEKQLLAAHKRLDIQHNTILVLARKIKELEKQ